MSVTQSTQPYKMKLRLEITDPRGRTEILEADNLEFGPGILFSNYETNELEDTSFTLEHHTELDNEPALWWQKLDRIPAPGREFLKINLLALAKPSEDPKWPNCVYRTIDPERYHELAEIHACSKLLATYRCTCGAVGKATLPRRIYARRNNVTVEDLARKNHKSHAVRARAAAERKRKLT